VILQGNQRVNIVVRGLIFREGHLLVTQWKSRGESFAIGGRVEFGEPLVEALRREVLEETGAEVSIKKLLYFGENIFHHKGTAFHEYGWYFWVEPDRDICTLDEIIPNPDHADLIIRYLKVDQASLNKFWPRFLGQFLPADFADGFSQNPRYVYSQDQPVEPLEIRELEGLFL
jgi:8-oxo-dGTP pyrophosphatase MutT (NUDIX family)